MSSMSCVPFTGDGGSRGCHRNDVLLLQAMAVDVFVIDVMCSFYRRWR